MITRRVSRIRLVSLTLATTGALLVGTAGAATAAPPTDTSLTHRLQRVLDTAVAKYGVVGAGATIRDRAGTTDLTAGRGSISPDRPFPHRGHYRIASITKTFTAAMVLQLVEERRLGLDDRVSHYLPGLLRGNTSRMQITVRQLLRHQSGLPDYSFEPENAAAAEPLAHRFTPTELVGLGLRHADRFSPGTRMEYSNTNYIVAGMLIEKVTGHPYDTELRRRILNPLHLRDTIFPINGQNSVAGVHGTGYERVAGMPVPIPPISPTVTWAAAAIQSTGADLTRFVSDLARGRVVRGDAFAAMNQTVPTSMLPHTRYGLGIIAFTLPCGIVVHGHTGDTPGYHSVAASTANGTRSVAVTMTATPQTPGDPIGIEGRLLGAALCD